jgi:predicted DNA-binding protein
MITLDLDQTLEQEINDIASSTGKNPGQFLTEIIKVYLEDRHDAKLAEQALKEIDSGEAKVLSWDEVKAGLYDLDN